MRDLNDKPLFVLVVWERENLSPGRPAGADMDRAGQAISCGKCWFFCHRERAAPWRSI